MKTLVIAFVVLLLANCSVYKLVPPGKIKIGNAFSAQPQIAWSKYEFGKNESWTIDGLALQSLQFTKGLEDGETLYDPALVKSSFALPKFSKKMSP